MEKTTSFDEQLLSDDERRQVERMWEIIPEQDRKGIDKGDIVFVLDAIDDFMEALGLIQVDEASGEVIYEDGEIDETEQLEFIERAVKAAGLTLTGAQIQIILDAEYQYGVEEGYYEDED